MIKEFINHYQVKALRQASRRMRRQPTKSEDLLWQALRKRQLARLKFRRQHPIGPAILDFYCHEKRLAVEVDGGVHQENDVKEHDQARQELIELYGVRFYRCKAEEVENNLEDVLESILEAAREDTSPPGGVRTSPPSLARCPLSLGRGGNTKCGGEVEGWGNTKCGGEVKNKEPNV